MTARNAFFQNMRQKSGINRKARQKIGILRKKSGIAGIPHTRAALYNKAILKRKHE